MTDIVQRLTTVAWNDGDEICSLAADEITQLRADRDIWRQKAIELGLELSEMQKECDAWKAGALQRDGY